MKGLLVTLQVIHALVLRETRTRFGTHRLGYLWAFADPLVNIGVFAALFYWGRSQPPFGMDLVSFLATGFLPLMLFRSTSQRAVTAIDGNKGLLFYPQVRPLDLVLARALLEAVTLFVVFGVIMAVVGFVKQSFAIDDLLTTLVGLGLAAGLGVALGLVVCGLSAFWNAADKVEGYLLRPMMWISGVFFTANDLPKYVRDALLYNPVFHTTELVRDGWFHAYTARYASATYALAWIVVLLFFGLVLERAARKRLEVV